MNIATTGTPITAGQDCFQFSGSKGKIGSQAGSASIDYANTAARGSDCEEAVRASGLAV
jgi:hypothetical protein